MSSAASRKFTARGTWDEAGLVRNLDRMGFTVANCANELIGNSIDAGATELYIECDGDESI